MMNIDLIKKLSDSDNLIIIGRKSDPFGKFLKNKNERDWLKAVFQKKARPLAINQYKRWIFILPVEEDKKPVHELLEEIRKGGKNLWLYHDRRRKKYWPSTKVGWTAVRQCSWLNTRALL